MRKTLGMRHVALFVKDPAKSAAFYQKILGMQLEWNPDPDNFYLTSESQDNLAIHRGSSESVGSGPLDHIGFILPTLESVDEWYSWIMENKVPVAKEIKTHRDGARSFYIRDPDGIVVQMIFHPPISLKTNR